jgi:ketosteroid isomerase-like protein
MANTEVIRQVYAAFEIGDFAAVLELCDPECSVTQDDALPWGGRYAGHDGAAAFAIALGGTIDSTVSVIAMFEAGDRVVQYGRTRGTVLANGNTFDIPEVHVWTLRAGKIIAAEFHLETAAMLVALGSAAG